MAWDKGSITSDTPAAALSDKLKTLVASTDNWSFVENVPAGTGAGESGSASYSVDVAKRLAWRVSARLDGVKQTAQPTRELLRALKG